MKPLSVGPLIVEHIGQKQMNSAGDKAGDDFYQAFSARIQALAKTHDLLVKGDWQGSDLVAYGAIDLD